MGEERFWLWIAAMACFCAHKNASMYKDSDGWWVVNYSD